MSSTFIHLLDKSIIVYLDDMIVFSRRINKHLNYLKKETEKCRERGISLNPKKLIFTVIEGKFLGHIISKEGIKINPKRVKKIQ